MTDRESKINEVATFSKRQAERYYTVAKMLSNISKYMENNNVDYGTLFRAVNDAVDEANNRAASYWADYKSADRIVDFNPPLCATKAHG